MMEMSIVSSGIQPMGDCLRPRVMMVWSRYGDMTHETNERHVALKVKRYLIPQFTFHFHYSLSLFFIFIIIHSAYSYTGFPPNKANPKPIPPYTAKAAIPGDTKGNL
mmetsp:Transcript_6401/g.12070  ORF Transcript_6401/g.12070 Transcript_6401/m.12070 type:complete len:107 (+) Transcript_6401:1387-1707(+)